MELFQPRKLYLPAMIIVAIVLSLLVFIGFSTYWHLNHSRSNALKFIHQRGVATVQVIATSVISHIESGNADLRSIDLLISDIGKNEYISYAYILSKEDGILHQSADLPANASDLWQKTIYANETKSNRIIELSGGIKVYELAEIIKPLLVNQNNSREIFNKYHGAVIIIGLSMSTYEMARQMDFQHAIVMLSILAILGGGAVFFIFVIHLYHRMNKRLREAQDYTRQVVDSMANGLLSIDEAGRVISYNNLSLEILGLAQSEINQFDLNKIIDFQTSGISQTLKQCVTILDREINIFQPGGERLPLAISVTPILSLNLKSAEEGTCQGAVIILRDLREIKLLEEKVRRTEKLAALGKLSAAVAHEIRNPLSSIRGFAKFLSHTLKDQPKDQEYADVMVKEVDRINRVVTDLLNFASPLELAPEYVNPAELIEHTVRLVEGDAQTRNINIEMNTENSPEAVFIDPYQITQVLLNLMLNALQAIGAGQSMNVGAAINKASSAVTFWVEDDGPGIPEDHIGKIFDPFFTRREKGTGLGLAIVQKIVENHHGTVQVISPLPGKIYGCQFVISIPMDLESQR